MPAISSPETTEIYREASLSLVVKPQADAAALSLLKGTIYGTKGVRYRQTNQEERLRELYNPFFFHLYEEETLLGVYCLDHRVVEVPWGWVDSFYGRYLAVTSAAQGRGYGRLLKTQAVAYLFQQIPAPFLVYSFIEARNTRSVAVSQTLQFECIARLQSYLFRRLNPKRDTRFRALTKEEESQLLPSLQDSYQPYAFKTWTKTQGNFYGLWEANQIVAAVAARRVRWQFRHMLGAGGWFLMHGLRYVPVLKNLFQPDYAFVALEAVYLKAGFESLLPTLLESLLVHMKRYTALWQLDERRTEWTRLPDMGFFSGFQAGVSTQVWVQGKGLSEAQWQQLRQSPVYVSSFDYT
ncbi:GNAT family N-acetyltransferase [Siphonobacter sp.]|uniref:GNAT family N-acetyltransferase n=1 Tax=Siphonobacter sp. TaxID=1869184 RepID=UPI003B3A0E88